ncbi:histone deacetylase 14 [Tanacetum coccineum]
MDVHHENGTNDAFHDEPGVLFLPVHQKKNDDIGYGNGEGSTLNLALTKLTGDVVMRTVFDELIVPAAQKFKPNIILVSARYDGHVLDPHGKFELTTGGDWLYRSLKKAAAFAKRLLFIVAISKASKRLKGCRSRLETQWERIRPRNAPEMFPCRFPNVRNVSLPFPIRFWISKKFPSRFFWVLMGFFIPKDWEPGAELQGAHGAGLFVVKKDYQLCKEEEGRRNR